MANEQQNPEEGVDFSNYYNQPGHQPMVRPSMTKPPAPFGFAANKRLWILISILLLLCVAQAMILLLPKGSKNEIAPGYHIVKPTNGPIRVEKIK